MINSAVKQLLNIILLVPFVLLAQTKIKVNVPYNSSVAKDSVISKRTNKKSIKSTDTIYISKDGKLLKHQLFYDSLYAKASKSVITKNLYNLLVTRPPSKIESIDYENSYKSESFFAPFQGKVISSIEYRHVDVFEGSVYDTLKTSSTPIIKLTNKVHYHTTKRVINNQLLFDEGDRVDKYAFADSERLLRSLRYIEDARILLKMKKEDKNQVDVIVITKDRFPWSLTGSGLTGSTYSIDLLNRNAFGTGNEFSVGYRHSANNMPTHGYDVSYTFRNIKKSFINTTVFLANNHIRRGQGITFSRGFISPSIKYIGEATFEKVANNQDFVFADSLLAENFTSENTHYDFWLARSFAIGKRTNLGASVRLNQRNYSQRPAVKIDSNEFYLNSKMILGSMFFSRINFLKSQNIYSFNITEDIPIGHLHTLIFGPQWTEFGRRYYSGVRSKYAFYTDLGYFQFNAEFGTYFQRKSFRNTIFQLNNVYFSPLFQLGKSSARVYLRTNYFRGQNLSIPISGTLSDENHFREFEGIRINGNHVVSLNVESILFTPWYFYGFRFAPFVYVDHGYVKETRIQQSYEKLYSGIGGGFRIRNESLVLNTFEIRFTAFPSFPENGQPYSLSFSFSNPRLFNSPSIRKPTLVGIER